MSHDILGLHSNTNQHRQQQQQQKASLCRNNNMEMLKQIFITVIYNCDNQQWPATTSKRSHCLSQKLFRENTDSSQVAESISLPSSGPVLKTVNESLREAGERQTVSSFPPKIYTREPGGTTEVHTAKDVIRPRATWWCQRYMQLLKATF